MSGEAPPIWFGVVAIIIGVGLTMSALVTGKALNPLRGLRPSIVTRADEPGRYWASVAMNLIPIVVGCVATWSAISS
jgi:hypothetical protein